MTEIKSKEQFQVLENLNQLDILFEIYKLREARKKIEFKLNSMKQKLKSSTCSKIKYSFRALKVIVRENNSKFKDLTAKIKSNNNLFELTKNLKENQIFLKNIENGQKKRRIEPETYELTKGYYLQRIIDTIDNLKQLKKSALSYLKESKNDLIDLEDQRIVITTDKMRKVITKEEYKEKLQEIENKKQEIEEKMAFLQVKIIDYEFNKKYMR